MDKKRNVFSLTWVLIIVVITSIISGLAAGIIIYNDNKIAGSITYSDLSKDNELNQFLEIYANITTQYYEEVNKEKMLEEAISAMMEYVGDDYTTYLNDENTIELMNQLSGEYTGIGIAINNNTKTITKVYEDTPASKAGIKEGDIIVGYNEQDVTQMTASEVVTLIKENSGYFTLKLQRGEQILSISLKNETIISPNIDYKIIENTNIGYIYIQTFSKTLKTQMEKALKNMEKSGINSLIIDLRDNTGGYLDVASDVTSMFTKKGEKIYSLNYKNEITHYFDKTSENRNYNIIVLTNKNTASASEIMASALKENYGAKIVGETSFGKGKVQQTMELENGSMIKYTSAYWLTPSGACIDGVGIVPDYLISNEEKFDENGNSIGMKDNQLEKAINMLRGE